MLVSVKSVYGSVAPKHPSILNLFMKQIEMVCQQLAEDPLLQNGYHALGFSQVTKHFKIWPTKKAKNVSINSFKYSSQGLLHHLLGLQADSFNTKN